MDLSQTPVWVQAVVLGLVQGFSEFLPISSSGHLALIPQLTNWTYLGKPFDVALHFGTLLALLGHFQDEIQRLLTGSLALVRRSIPRKPLPGQTRNSMHRLSREFSRDERLALAVGLASLPAGLAGFIFQDPIEQHFGGLGSIALFLAVFGIVLGLAERVGSQKLDNLDDLTPSRALWIGCAQALALLPGVSRSGVTISAALLMGLTREQSARFSYLAGLPVIAGACLYKALPLLDHPQPQLALPCLLGILTSAVSGWFCMGYLMRYLRRRSFLPFVLYRCLLAACLWAWILWQVLA